MAKLDSILEDILKLSFNSREILLEKLKGIQLEARHDRLLRNGKQALKDYRSGKLKAQTAEEVIKELNSL